MSELIRSIATGQPNRELAAQLAGLADRLSRVRACETRIFPGACEEADALWSLWDNQHREELRLCLREHYHERMARTRQLADLLAEQASEQT